MLAAVRSRINSAHVVATVALVFAFGGFAIARIPASDGTITACYSKTGGSVRIVDEKSKCKKGEARLKWNQQGQPGIPGAPGAPGANGSDGQPGPPGPSTGPAGGDLQGSYPNPSLAPPEAVRYVAEPAFNHNCEGPNRVGEFCRGDQAATGAGVHVVRYANYGQGFESAGFWKDRAGVVHLQGSVKRDGSTNFAIAQPVFILPPGYRPGTIRRFETKRFLGENTYEEGIKVQPDGRVMLDTRTFFSYLALDGVYFRP